MKPEKSMSGMITVEFTSAEPENTLDVIAQEKIPVANVVPCQALTYRIRIHHRDYRKLSHILQKHNAGLKIIGRQGFYWTLRNVLKRPVLLTVFLILLLLSFWLPTRIFFISVDGNQTIPDQQILSAAESCGIRFGASRKLVRSEKVKNALLSDLPKLQWAGINTSGCVAVISVRERTEETEPKPHIISNLVAEQDGYILSATITGGTAQVQPGDSVTKGQVLVSGYTDCGICIRASRAEGEILAQTSRKLRAVIPENYAIAQIHRKPYYKISLQLRKKRIILWKDSRISDTTCGRMYEEYYVSLPGGFQLPFAVCIDRYWDYDLQEAAIAETDAQLQLQEFSEDYLQAQMISGQILEKQQYLLHSVGLYQMESRYVCTELIGKERREQIGDMNGKRY